MSATEPTATFEFDEFGNSTGTVRKYGWPGGGGATNGAGLRGNSNGRAELRANHGAFISMDPMLGGSAYSYEYAGGDPVNNFDLTGEWFYSKACWGGVVGCQCQLELWFESYTRGHMKIRMRRRCNRAGGITKTGWAVRYEIGKEFSEGGGSFNGIPTPSFIKIGGGAKGPNGGPCRDTDPCQNTWKYGGYSHVLPIMSIRSPSTGDSLRMQATGLDRYITCRCRRSNFAGDPSWSCDAE